jgi:hypothetical protein
MQECPGPLFGHILDLHTYVKGKGRHSLCPLPAFKLSDDSIMLGFAIAMDCEALLPRARFCAL